MSEVIEQAVAALQDKLGDSDFDASVRFEIAGEGTVIVDENGVRAGDGDEEAQCTLTADAETFAAMMDGSLNPTAAFMQGKLTVDGDMGVAMRLGSLLG